MDKGLRLVELRNEMGKSQVEAARYLGISKQTLYKYEKGIVTNIPSDVVERMASYYNTTPGYIMGWEDKDGNKTPHGELIDIYARNIAMQASDQELLDLFHNMLPETQDSVVQLIKSLQRQPDLPHLKNDKP